MWTWHLTSPATASGSFGLLQYGGRPTEWSKIHLRALEVTASDRASIRKKKKGHAAEASCREEGEPASSARWIVLARKLKRLGASAHKSATALLWRSSARGHSGDGQRANRRVLSLGLEETRIAPRSGSTTTSTARERRRG